MVPLFETVKDFREAGSVIRKLLSIDWYREHITKNHNGHQEVLITKNSYSNVSFAKVSIHETSGANEVVGR